MSGDAALDQGWLDAWVGRGRAPGGTGAVQLVVTGLPDGDGQWQVRVDDGVVAEVVPGAAKGAMTFTKAWNGVAPSTLAAFSSSQGISRKKADSV